MEASGGEWRRVEASEGDMEAGGGEWRRMEMSGGEWK